MSRLGWAGIVLGLVIAVGGGWWQWHTAVRSQGVAHPGMIVFQESFTRLSGAWREERRSGRTAYEIVGIDGRKVLKARAEASASTLIHPVTFDPRVHPILSWTWRVDEVPADADLRTKRGSDAAARIYVVFSKGAGFWQKRLLNYVWATREPSGTVLPSAFSSHSRIIVLRSGTERLGEWIAERRNVYVDYRQAFGEDPPAQAVAIALMTDTDNTGDVATAYVDEIAISN